MIATALRDDIDVYAVRMKRSNPLFFKAVDGTLSRQQMATYLASVRELLRNTERLLSRARVAASASGDAALSIHFARKLAEEVGHDQWADGDLDQVRRLDKADTGIQACESMNALIVFIEKVIDEDPVLYLSYILFAEYLIVLLGPEWLSLLETRCQIPRTSMTVIGNHVELDQDHVEAAMDEIDQLVGDPRKLGRMREVLDETTEHFDRFCHEVCRDSQADVHAA